MKNVSKNAIFLAKYLWKRKKSYTFAADKNNMMRQHLKKTETMRMSNSYFYGFYFYFAGNCEAEGRK